MVKKILKIISFTLLGIIAFALILSFVLWAVIPVYNFPEEVEINFITHIKIMTTPIIIEQIFMVIQGLQVGLQTVKITL